MQNCDEKAEIIINTYGDAALARMLDTSVDAALPRMPDTSGDAALAKMLSEELNFQPYLTCDADFAKSLSENMLEESNSRPDTSADADLAKLLASSELDIWNHVVTSGDAELARKLALADEDDKNFLKKPLGLSLDRLPEDNLKIPIISDDIKLQTLLVNDESSSGKPEHDLFKSDSPSGLTLHIKTGIEQNDIWPVDRRNRKIFLEESNSDLVIPKSSEIIIANDVVEIIKLSPTSTNDDEVRVISIGEASSQLIEANKSGSFEKSPGISGHIDDVILEDIAQIEQRDFQIVDNPENSLFHQKLTNDSSDIIFYPSYSVNIDISNELSKDHVASTDKIDQVIWNDTAAGLRQKNHKDLLLPVTTGITSFRAIKVGDNSADGNKVSMLSEDFENWIITNSLRTNQTRIVERQEENKLPDTLENSINKQISRIPVNKFLLNKVSGTGSPRGAFDLGPWLEESNRKSSPNTDSQSNYERKNSNTDTYYNDFEIARKLEEDWNKCPDTSRDADLARSMDISWDAEIAKSLRKYDNTVDVSRALPDTSHDAEFARAIARHFEESISVINKKTQLDFSFLEETADFSEGFCQLCNTPQYLSLKMQLGWMKEQKSSEDDSKCDLLILEEDPVSSKMMVKEIGDQISTKGNKLSKQLIHKSELEIIDSPCSVCRSFIGSTAISIAICSVIRRSKVSGRKAVNFDLAKQFIDVLTWLSPSIDSNKLPLKIVYHWTKNENFDSILDKNLAVPGNHGVEVVHGSVFGVGIYASDSFRYGRTYGEGAPEAIMLLGLLAPNSKPLCKKRSKERYSNYRVSNSIHVFFKSELVLPLFLTNQKNRLEQEHVANCIIELLNIVRPTNPSEGEDSDELPRITFEQDYNAGRPTNRVERKVSSYKLYDF